MIMVARVISVKISDDFKVMDARRNIINLFIYQNIINILLHKMYA